jgi:hypothetical protein
MGAAIVGSAVVEVKRRTDDPNTVLQRTSRI